LGEQTFQFDVGHFVGEDSVENAGIVDGPRSGTAPNFYPETRCKFNVARRGCTLAFTGATLTGGPRSL